MSHAEIQQGFWEWGMLEYRQALKIGDIAMEIWLREEHMGKMLVSMLTNW